MKSLLWTIAVLGLLSPVGTRVAEAGGCGSACTSKAGAAVEKGSAGEQHAKAHKHGRKEAAKVGTVSTAGLAALLNAGTDLVLLDARSDRYDDGRRIPGAKQLTATQAGKGANQYIDDKDALVVAYCSNVKCPASAKLAKRLQKLGYTNVLKYPAGIDGWVEAGHSVEKVD